MAELAQIASADAMRALGRRLAGLLRAGDLVLLTGPLGAGKTTLVQGIADGLRVRGPVTSPTFVIARVHPSLAGGPALVHADAYRLASPAEVDDLDLDTSLDTSVTVVEWGGGLAEGLAPDRLEITIGMPPPRPAGRTGQDGEPEPDDGTEPEGGAGPGNGPGRDAGTGDELRTVRVAGTGGRWRAALDSVRLAVRGGPQAL